MRSRKVGQLNLLRVLMLFFSYKSYLVTHPCYHSLGFILAINCLNIALVAQHHLPPIQEPRRENTANKHTPPSQPSCGGEDLLRWEPESQYLWRGGDFTSRNTWRALMVCVSQYCCVHSADETAVPLRWARSNLRRDLLPRFKAPWIVVMVL